MTPKPSSPHAGEILQGLWEDSLEPADLMLRSTELGALSAKLIAASEDGQVSRASTLTCLPNRHTIGVWLPKPSGSLCA